MKIADRTYILFVSPWVKSGKGFFINVSMQPNCTTTTDSPNYIYKSCHKVNKK